MRESVYTPLCLSHWTKLLNLNIINGAIQELWKINGSWRIWARIWNITKQQWVYHFSLHCLSDWTQCSLKSRGRRLHWQNLAQRQKVVSKCSEWRGKSPIPLFFFSTFSHSLVLSQFHHINSLKKKKNHIISIDTEKAYGEL